MTPAHAAAIQARRLSYALDRAGTGNETTEHVEREIERLLGMIEEWRATQNAGSGIASPALT